MLSSPRSLSKKVYRRGEHGSPGTPQSSLRLASSSVEEPKEKSPLIEEMPDRAEELFLPSSKGAGLAIIPLSLRDIPLFKGDILTYGRLIPSTIKEQGIRFLL